MHADIFIENYQQELALLHDLMAEFARDHPKVAARLRINNKGVADDEQMGRLIESSALLGAKAHFHLSDEFSEISDNFLAHLHPHAIAPIPAMSIVQFVMDQQKPGHNQVIPPDSVLLTEPIQEQPCFFKTRYAVSLLPLKIVTAALMDKPVQAPVVPGVEKSNSVLRLSLSCLHPEMLLAEINIKSWRFFIQAADNLAYALYELLFNECLEVVLANSDCDANPIMLGKQALKKVGFDPVEGMLPYGKLTPLGYRLLTEFFACPDKFLFFDIANGQAAFAEKFNQAGMKLEIYLYLKKSVPILLKGISADNFLLNCTPIVNLFAKKCTRFSINDAQTIYPLQPSDRSAIDKMEIYNIQQVMALSDQEKPRSVKPFHALKYHSNSYYYHVERKPAWYFGDYPAVGSEVALSLTDFENKSVNEKAWKMSVEVLCTNRNLPVDFNLKNHCQILKPEKKLEVVKQIKSVIPFTQTYHPFLHKKYKWQYVAHLSINFLWSLSLGDGTQFLHSLLALYAFGSEKYQSLQAGILQVQCKNTYCVKKRDVTSSPIWHGIAITVTIDESRFANKWFYLLFCLLNQFFPTFVSINFFTQLIIKNKEGLLYEFAPCQGEKQTI
jgi:type VI secretion system protein ImpG